MRQRIVGNRRYLFLATVLAVAVPALWFTFIWVVAPGLPPVPTSTGPVPTPTDVAPSPPPAPTPTDPVPTPTDVAVAPSPAGADREALVALYQATDGANWVYNANWLSDAPLDTWYGVTTDANGRVIGLDFAKNELSGAIPSALGNLTNLTWLDLSENELSGAIPPALGNLTNLTWLALSGNQLRGCVPAAWRNVEYWNDLDSLGLPFCDAS